MYVPVSPPQRSSDDVKELARCLAHFPKLLPGQSEQSVLEGVAARALGESIPPDFSRESATTVKNTCMSISGSVYALCGSHRDELPVYT